MDGESVVAAQKRLQEAMDLLEMFEEFEKRGEGLHWMCRSSVQGRGLRLHQTTTPEPDNWLGRTFPTAREALANWYGTVKARDACTCTPDSGGTERFEKDRVHHWEPSRDAYNDVNFWICHQCGATVQHHPDGTAHPRSR